MLNFGIIKSVAGAIKYFDPTGKDHDYWIEDRDTRAFFGGKLADQLGLKEFDINQLHALLLGIDPRTMRRNPETGRISGDQLTPGKKENKRPGFEVTVDGPKDLGVLMAMGLDDRIIPEVLERAGRDVMALIERDAKTRVRVGKQDTDRDTGNIVYAGVLHLTSRPVDGKIDVQPHIHFLIANATYDPVEKRYKALQLQPYALNGAKDARPYYMAYFNSQLARYMQGLGYQLEQTNDTFKVVGVPDRVRKEFSQRRQKIEAVAAELDAGIKEQYGPHAKLSREGFQKLAKTTRERKQPGRTWESLQEHWNSRVTDSERKAILETVTRSHQKPHAPALDHSAALDWAIKHEFERNSVVSERQILTTALKHGIGSVTPEGILDAMGRRKDLIRRKVKGREMVTTTGVLGEEKRIVEFAQKHRGRWRPLKKEDRGVVTPVMIPDLTILSRSQHAAIRHVWHSRDRLMIVRGAAGTGKTTMTRAMLEGINVPWVILAPSSEASRGVLRRDGFAEADTLSKFLTDDTLQAKAKGGLIVLDESSMAGAHDLARLVESADKLNARIVLLGDRRQHKSVARGDVLALLEDKANLPVATVSEIKRQAGQYRTAIEQAAKGDVSASYHTLDRLGWIKEGGIGQAVDKYMELKGEADVIAPVHTVGREFTTAIRERLKATPVDPKKPDGPKRLGNDDHPLGMLTPLHLTEAERSVASNLEGTTAVFHKSQGTFKAGQRVEVTAENSEALAKHPAAFATYMASNGPVATGDHLRITTGGKDITGKHRLNAGAQYQVTGWTEAGNPRLNNGWVIDKEFRGITHGYYRTSHAAQGRTTPHVIVLMSEAAMAAADKSQWYVSISRGKHGATVYTESKEALRDAIQRDDPRMLASELVRAPRKGISDRLKRHVHFLRDISYRVMGNTREPARVRDMGHERG